MLPRAGESGTRLPLALLRLPPEGEGRSLKALEADLPLIWAADAFTSDLRNGRVIMTHQALAPA